MQPNGLSSSDFANAADDPFMKAALAEEQRAQAAGKEQEYSDKFTMVPTHVHDWEKNLHNADEDDSPFSSVVGISGSKSQYLSSLEDKLLRLKKKQSKIKGRDQSLEHARSDFGSVDRAVVVSSGVINDEEALAPLVSPRRISDSDQGDSHETAPCETGSEKDPDRSDSLQISPNSVLKKERPEMPHIQHGEGKDTPDLQGAEYQSVIKANRKRHQKALESSQRSMKNQQLTDVDDDNDDLRLQTTSALPNCCVIM